jgi:hypothetical protein
MSPSGYFSAVYLCFCGLYDAHAWQVNPDLVIVWIPLYPAHFSPEHSSTILVVVVVPPTDVPLPSWAMHVPLSLEQVVPAPVEQQIDAQASQLVQAPPIAIPPNLG